jgi:hypothetical protein
MTDTGRVAFGGLGRRVAPDMIHAERYPLRAVLPRTVDHVERILPLPYQYRARYDQGSEGACVGFACSMMMSILNRTFYDARWLYQQAQQIDDWVETPPEEGTSVRAALDVLRDTGHRRVYAGVSRVPAIRHGVEENRWAHSVDELRTCIANGVPFVLGIEWFERFSSPVRVGNEWWIDKQAWGDMVGGHAIVAYGASDRRQAFKLCNSWGMYYPLSWLSYEGTQRLLDGLYYQGEATVVTDRL